MPLGRAAKRMRFVDLPQIPSQGNDGHSVQDVDHHSQQGNDQRDSQQSEGLGHHLQQGNVSSYLERDAGEGPLANRIFLKVEGKNFNPSGASRQLVKIFKKSFSGAWVTWGKIPKYVKDRWFNQFQRLYYWNEEDEADIRSHFEHVGSVRLTNTMNKAKKEFYKKKTIPQWICEVHWKEMMVYWQSDDFKAKSLTSTKNRLSNTHGNGPSLHTGGSIPVSDYKRKYMKEKGEEPNALELFFMTHRTKNNEWVDSKSKAVWLRYKKCIKKHLDNVSGMQVGDAVNGEEASNEETSEEDDDDEEFVRCQSLLPKEQVASAWIEAAGGVGKGRLYGLGSESSTFVSKDHHTSGKTLAPTPSTHDLGSSNFQEIVNRAVEEKLVDMRAKLQEELQANIHAAIFELLRSGDQPPI